MKRKLLIKFFLQIIWMKTGKNLLLKKILNHKLFKKKKNLIFFPPFGAHHKLATAEKSLHHTYRYMWNIYVHIVSKINL